MGGTTWHSFPWHSGNKIYFMKKKIIMLSFLVALVLNFSSCVVRVDDGHRRYHHHHYHHHRRGTTVIVR
jgi:hypothetical protein